MRRFLFGVVLASVTAAMPTWAFGGDREIAKAVKAELQQHKSAGDLKGFDIDLKVVNGIVYLDGRVASRAQRALVAKAAANAAGVGNLVNKIRVKAGDVPPTPVKKRAITRKLGPTPKVRPVAIPEVRPVSTTQRATKPSAQDVAVTDAIIGQLQTFKSTGQLRGFELDVSTVNGDVWLRGKVTNRGQKSLILDATRRTRGVSRVIDDITVTNIANPVSQPIARNVPRVIDDSTVTTGSAVRQVSTGDLAPAAKAPSPIPQGSSMPVVGQPMHMTPRAFAPSGLASMPKNDGYVAGRPVVMQGAGGQYGAGAPRYDQPNMPAYAWPSYAAHPNYSAVTYPKQYSPSAWPYIGPFYPYPQVPLGWRKVSLEWDDGLWYLDFTSK